MPTAVKKISALPEATELTGAELVPVVQDGITSRIAVNDLLAFVPTTGLILTYATTTSFSVGTGFTSNDIHEDFMKITSSYTKTTSTWAAGTSVGGLDTGTIASNTWYYVYVIKNPTSDLVDWIYSASASSPTLPSGYTKKRMIGAVKTNGSSQFIQWIMYEDGTQRWNSIASDLDDSTSSLTRKTHVLLNAPAIKSVLSLQIALFCSSTANSSVYFVGDSSISDQNPYSVYGLQTLVSQVVSSASGHRTSGFICLSGSIYYRTDGTTTRITALVESFNIRPFH